MKKRYFDTAVDDNNWEQLYHTHYSNLQSLNAIYPLWQSGFDKLGIDNSKRPLSEDLTKAAHVHTGFQFIQTDQSIILEQIDWYTHIANSEMPMTCFLRTPDELAYCDEPDIWHDIMGHVPFLIEKEYVEMYQLLANTYITAYQKKDAKVLRQLDFIGGMLIELGLIREYSEIKAFGATFYSSSEVFEAYKPENQISFTKEALDSGESYNRHQFQGKYYIFDSLDQLTEIIHDISRTLK